MYNIMLLCISPLEAESIKTRYALFRQLPRAILHDLFSCVPDVRTELVEAAVFVSIHVDVTVRLRALLEVVNPLVERPCDVFASPIKAGTWLSQTFLRETFPSDVCGYHNHLFDFLRIAASNCYNTGGFQTLHRHRGQLRGYPGFFQIRQEDGYSKR
jgi:hypothetical protein